MPKAKFDPAFIGKIVLITWIAFTSLYFVYGEYSRFSNFVSKSAYNQGMSEAAMAIIQESQKCQPVPVNVAGLSATLINTKCFQQEEGQEALNE